MAQLPKPGEPGWQGRNLGKWFDLDIVAGPFYSEGEYLMGTGALALGPHPNFPVYRCAAAGEHFCVPFKQMRRKPEQRDNQPASESFHRWLKGQMGVHIA